MASPVNTVNPIRIQAQPLTPLAWAPFGDVIEASSSADHFALQRGPRPDLKVNPIKHTIDLGFKFNRVAPITSSYPTTDSSESTAKPITSISLVRIGPTPTLKLGQAFPVQMMERHLASSQAFIPFARPHSSASKSKWDQWRNSPDPPSAGSHGSIGSSGINTVESLEGECEGMLVLGCLNGQDDRPDFATLKAFIASPSQGVSYNEGIWHHSMLAFSYSDYAVIDTQITTDSSIKIDCDIVRPDPSTTGIDSFAVIDLPNIL